MVAQKAKVAALEGIKRIFAISIRKEESLKADERKWKLKAMLSEKMDVLKRYFFRKLGKVGAMGSVIVLDSQY